MGFLDGYRRHKASLNDHVEGQKIRPKLIEVRAQFARGEALKYFFDAKRQSDFYFEEILNSFIALAQYPLNFAVFTKDAKGMVERVAHFCIDKKHESQFLKGLESFELCDDPDGEQNVFRLFPDLLKAPAHFIAVYHMSTKDDHFQFCPVPAHASVFPLYRSGDEAFVANPPWIEDAQTYISSCADYFFQFKWDAFTSEFADRATGYLTTSLEQLSAEQPTWSKRTKRLIARLEEVTVEGGRAGADEWKQKLESTFESVLFHATDGINLVTKMMRRGSDLRDMTPNPNLEEEGAPPNMFVAFRVFSRNYDEFRHDLNKAGNGYLYDTSFLMPDTLEDRFIAMLDKIKRDGHEAMVGGAAKFAKNFEGADKRKRLFRNVLSGDEETTADLTTLRAMDDKFWSVLNEEGGPKECVRILSTWVGDKCRSLVDPVYHTGLIHTNHLFKNGGLDRLGMLRDFTANQFEDIPGDCHDDVLRVVIFYYVLSEIVGWAPNGQEFHPSKLAAILVPIKMRGSVWGVSIHGAYTPEYPTIFADERYWQAYFKLATDLKHKNNQIFDRYMWALGEEMVEKLFLDLYLPLDGSPPDLEEAEYAINSALDNAETTSPFAFPRIYLSRERRQDKNYVRVVPESKLNYWICWNIHDNQLFTANQVWDKSAIRKFQRVIHHGIMRAINRSAQSR